MDVIITENIEGVSIDALSEKFKVYRDEKLWDKRLELFETVSTARAVIVRNQTKVDRSLLENAKSLQIVARAGAGYDNIDVAAASKLGIVVSYTPEGNSISTAEHAFALMLALSRKLVVAHRDTALGGWSRYSFVGTELFGKTLGILGFGKVGARIAIRARAFGMRVVAYDKYILPNQFTVTETGVELKPLEEVLKESDIVSAHLPLNQDTIGLLNYDKLKLMKKSAFLVNTSRGGIVVEKDLIQALEEKLIAGAALDVREKEPPEESKLNHMDNVILTPHVAAFTWEAQKRVVDTVVEDVTRVLHGVPALNYVNFSLPKKGSKNVTD